MTGLHNAEITVSTYESISCSEQSVIFEMEGKVQNMKRCPTLSRHKYMKKGKVKSHWCQNRFPLPTLKRD